MADERQRELERKASAGDVEAEAKLLLERVRSGDLTEERLKLAAYLGHEPAAVAVGIAASPFPPTQDIRRWLAAAPHLGELGLWRAALATIEATEGACGVRVSDGGPTILALTTDAEQWVLELTRERPPSCQGHVGTAHAIVGDGIPLLGSSVLAERIRTELLPWALGLGDPVRDRVEARKREAAE